MPDLKALNDALTAASAAVDAAKAARQKAADEFAAAMKDGEMYVVEHLPTGASKIVTLAGNELRFRVIPALPTGGAA